VFAWRDDFQLTLHVQDDVRTVRETGNIFLTNVHRVFLGDVSDPSLEDEDPCATTSSIRSASKRWSIWLARRCRLNDG